MSYRYLSVEHRGTIAVVTFNRPDVANALNLGIMAEIEKVALSFQDDTETRVVVFTGSGKHFTSGKDLSEPSYSHEPLVKRRRLARYGERLIKAILGMDQITIAAWKGAAMGGGACIATAVDFRIGSKSCFMSYPEIRIGVNLMWASLPLLVHLAGPSRAKQLVIGGQLTYGPKLEQWGVLDEMVDDEDTVMPAALNWAAHYAAQSPVAAQMIKRSVNAISSALDNAIMHMDFDQHALVGSGDDCREAVAAYLEKRTPNFTGN